MAVATCSAQECPYLCMTWPLTVPPCVRVHATPRDMKPDNLIVMEDHVVKLTDLGLARELGSEEVARSHTGTPEYMAP